MVAEICIPEMVVGYKPNQSMEQGVFWGEKKTHTRVGLPDTPSLALPIFGMLGLDTRTMGRFLNVV